MRPVYLDEVGDMMQLQTFAVRADPGCGLHNSGKCQPELPCCCRISMPIRDSRPTREFTVTKDCLTQTLCCDTRDTGLGYATRLAPPLKECTRVFLSPPDGRMHSRDVSNAADNERPWWPANEVR